MTKIVFFDIDGTLISRTTHKVAESTLKAIEELQAKGIICCVATGRGRATVPESFVDIFDLIVALNGQYCYDKDRVIFKHQLERDDVAVLVDFALNTEVPVYFVTEDGYFVNVLNDLIREDSIKHDFPLPKVLDPRLALEQPIYAASVFLDPEGEKAFLSKTKNLDGTRWDDAFFDVVLKGIGKHSALTEVCELFGIDPKDSMAFGDGGNDLSMLREAGIGIAMGNAKDIVKESADYVTDDEDNDGIANALKHFGLID